MYPESISAETKRVLEKIKETKISSDFYLAGGTALAIILGHRESIDLDWFSPKNFSNREIKDLMSKIGNFELSKEEEGTLHGTLDQVRVSFLRYPYKSIFPLKDFEGIKIADERDIAAMKIDAISSRGSKKDFIDLYFLLKKYSLGHLISYFEKKYSNIKYNQLHILKSLSFFEDSEEDPMPVMLKPAKWESIKNKIIEEVKNFLDK